MQLHHELFSLTGIFDQKENQHSKRTVVSVSELFHDGGRYHIETSPVICSANQWTGFYMITTSVMKELRETSCPISVATISGHSFSTYAKFSEKLTFLTP